MAFTGAKGRLANAGDALKARHGTYQLLYRKSQREHLLHPYVEQRRSNYETRCLYTHMKSKPPKSLCGMAFRDILDVLGITPGVPAQLFMPRRP